MSALQFDYVRAESLITSAVRRAEAILNAIDENGEIDSYTGACGFSQKALDRILKVSQAV